MALLLKGWFSAENCKHIEERAAAELTLVAGILESGIRNLLKRPPIPSRVRL
jgi:hypothetical protein